MLCSFTPYRPFVNLYRCGRHEGTHSIVKQACSHSIAFLEIGDTFANFLYNAGTITAEDGREFLDQEAKSGNLPIDGVERGRLNLVEHLPWSRLRDRCRADLERALLRREVECFLFGHFSVVS